MAHVMDDGTLPRSVLRDRLPFVTLALLVALLALAIASSAEGAELQLTATSFTVSDGDVDGYDDTVTVNATVYNVDPVQFRAFTLEVVLEHASARVDLQTRDGQLDAGEGTDLTVTVGTDTSSPAGTYTVQVFLHAGDLTGEVEDSNSSSADLHPRGEYVVSVQVNRTSVVALENTSVDFQLTVGSTSNNPTGVDIDVLTSLGWETVLERGSVQLAPGETSEVRLAVQVTPNAPPNQRETVTVQVTSTRNGTAFATVSVSVTVEKQTFGVELVLVTTSVSVASGDTVTASGRVLNRGNNLDNVTMMADVPPGWDADFVPSHLLVNRGTWMDFVLHLTPPASLKESGSTRMNITALSSGLVAESVVPLTVIYNSAELNMTGAEIILTPSMPTAGQTVTLQVTFGNGGSVTAENVLVVVLSDDGELARTFVDDIPPGGIGVATLQWKAAAGTQLLRVVVDPENDLAEPNESNNEATWTMRVSSPDLSVTTTGITISPDYPTEGTDAIISVVVRNLAEQIAPPFDVTLSLEGTTVRTFTVDTGLAGGANVTLETNWTALLGRHEFTVTADPLGHVAEEDRTNNVASRSFSVNTRPIAQLVILMTEVNEGETVSMDASDSEDPDGRVRQYFFDYGDGTDSGWVFSSTINHTYGQTGTFEVRAYVRDEGGAQSAEPALVEVTVNELDKEEGEDTPTLTAPAVLAAIATVAVLAALRGRTRRGEGPGR